MSELMSVSAACNTVVFTSFPDSLRGKGLLFRTKNGCGVRSDCFPEVVYNCIYVCGTTESKDKRELNFETIDIVEEFLSGLEEYCLKNNISFSCDGKIVLGGL